QQYRAGFLRAFPECEHARRLEGDFRGVHRVEGAVVTLGFDVHGGIAGQHAVLHRLLDALFHRRDVLPRNGATHDRVLDLEARAALERADLDPAVAELAPAAGLLLVTAVRFDGRLDRFLVGDFDLRRDDLGAELPLQPVDDDVQMRLAHPGDDGLARLRIAL